MILDFQFFLFIYFILFYYYYFFFNFRFTALSEVMHRHSNVFWITQHTFRSGAWHCWLQCNPWQYLLWEQRTGPMYSRLEMLHNITKVWKMSGWNVQPTSHLYILLPVRHLEILETTFRFSTFRAKYPGKNICVGIHILLEDINKWW